MTVRSRTRLVVTAVLLLVVSASVPGDAVVKKPSARGSRDKVEIIANKLAQTSLRLPKNMRPKNAELVATLTPHEMEAVQTISQEIYRAEAALVQAWWGPGAGVRLDDGMVLVTSRRAGDNLLWVRLAEADS